MKKQLWLGIGICVIVGVLYQIQYIFNIQRPLGITHGDAFLVNFIFKHYMQVISSGHWTDLGTLPMFYGFKNSLFYSDHLFIHAVFALPIYLITKNIIVTSHIIFICTIITSLVSMYLLCFYWTKKMLPSVLGAIVFVLNPFVFARFPDQLILLSLQWIPLIFLFFERSLKKPSSRNTFLFWFFLVCQLLSSLYYSVFLTVIIPIYCGVRLWQEKKSLKTFLNAGTVIGIILFLVTALISGYLYSQVFSTESINRGLETVDVYSAWPTDYLFAPPSNVLYGGLKDIMVTAFPTIFRRGIYSEQNLFAGLTVLTLFVISFFTVRKSSRKNIWKLFTGLLLFSTLLSFGPNINFTLSLKVPSVDRVIHLIDPFFSFLRAESRFGVFVFFFLSLIVAFTLVELSKRLTPTKAVLIGVAIISLTLLEYLNKPLEFMNIPSSTREFYSAVNRKSNIKVIAEIPIANDIPLEYIQSRPEDLDSHYLLWASILHDKVLFNGYTGFFPHEYYERTRLLSMEFPSLETVHLLIRWGVDGVILDKNEYNSSDQYNKAVLILRSLSVPLVEKTDTLSFYDLTKWKKVQ